MDAILVTGGTGLVGSRLLRRLVEEGRDVRGLVRAGRRLPDGTTAVQGDVLAPDSLGAAVAGVSAVVHLAASFRAGDDEETWRVNLEGTRNLLAATRAHAPGARFVMASTSNVYDADGGRPATEEDDVHPVLAYPASKVRAEQELRASGLTHAILRLPFVYGERDGHLGTAIPLLVRMGRHPAQRMSTAHHADVAAAVRLALTGAMDGRTVNISDDAPLSLHELAAVAGTAYPASAEPVADPWQGVVDGSLARRLGFRPTVRTVLQAAEQDLL